MLAHPLPKAWFTIFFISINSDAKKRIKHMICSGTSAIGTSRGKPKNVGRSTVNVGIARIKFEL